MIKGGMKGWRREEVMKGTGRKKGVIITDRVWEWWINEKVIIIDVRGMKE